VIPYNGWDREYQDNQSEYLDVFDWAMRQSKYDSIEWFETKIASYAGRKHAVSVASATDALLFSLVTHGIGPGDEVLVPDFSWISTSSCVTMAGATPVFCDIDLESYHIDIDSIRRMISDKTKALIYVHLFGNMTDTREIEEFCKDNDIVLIEDAAQALGSSLNGAVAGSLGDSSVFSFNTNKVIAGINGGGVYLTDNDKDAECVRKLKNHGCKKSNDFEILGYNAKMYALNAAIIDKRLDRMTIYQEKRNTIANRYNKAFKDLPIHLPILEEGLNHNYHKYVVRFEDRETRDMMKELLGAQIHYETTLSHNSMYQHISHRKDNCNNSFHATQTVLSLPIHPWLHEEEISSIINTIDSFF
jgi:dTDP-4-amino-4,6-dideoxygalactose transaminase